MRRGAAALNYTSPTNFSKAINPALERIALLFKLDPQATMEDFMQALQEVPLCTQCEAQQRLRELAGKPGSEMDESEFLRRQAMLEGRLDPAELFPKAAGRKEDLCAPHKREQETGSR